MTTITLTWSRPTEANGVLRKYVVCWRLVGGKALCKDEPAIVVFPYVIRGLQPGKTYNITVQASTTAGKGPAAVLVIPTLESGKLYHRVDTYRGLTPFNFGISDFQKNPPCS